MKFTQLNSHSVQRSAFIFKRYYLICILAIAIMQGCSIEKQYHSWGFKISSKNSLNPNLKLHVSSDNAYRHISKKSGVLNSNYNHSLPSEKPTYTPAEKSNNSQSNAFNTHLPWVGSVASSIYSYKYAPTDTVFFPEKYQHRKHGTLYLPQINNEEEFNSQTKLANLKDVTAWNWFDRGHIAAKMALYFLFFLMAGIIVIGLGNISLAGIAPATRKSIVVVLLLIPALLFSIGYICYLLGTFSIWSANKIYKNAVTKLPYDLKLRGDAIIMHARIPYVSKGATLRNAKRILNTYPNDRNGEWLEDVSKTRKELLTGRTSLTINNWSRMRTVGFITTLVLLAVIAASIL